MKLAVLFSGGKDSCLALHKVLQQGHEVLYLLNIAPENFDSFMFHKPYQILLERQAKELGVELVQVKTKGEKEKELKDLEKLVLKVKDNVGGIVVGGIASDYQGSRIKKICDKFDLKFVAPLLGYSPEKVWEELLREKFEVVLTKVSCGGLDNKWVGRKINKESFKELKSLAEKHKFRIDFEGGEAESAVLNMPEFGQEIKFDFDVVSEGEYRHFMKLRSVK